MTCDGHTSNVMSIGMYCGTSIHTFIHSKTYTYMTYKPAYILRIRLSSGSEVVVYGFRGRFGQGVGFQVQRLLP